MPFFRELWLVINNLSFSDNDKIVNRDPRSQRQICVSKALKLVMNSTIIVPGCSTRIRIHLFFTRKSKHEFQANL